MRALERLGTGWRMCRSDVRAKLMMFGERHLAVGTLQKPNRGHLAAYEFLLDQPAYLVFERHIMQFFVSAQMLRCPKSLITTWMRTRESFFLWRLVCPCMRREVRCPDIVCTTFRAYVRSLRGVNKFPISDLASQSHHSLTSPVCESSCSRNFAGFENDLSQSSRGHKYFFDRSGFLPLISITESNGKSSASHVLIFLEADLISSDEDALSSNVSPRSATELYPAARCSLDRACMEC